MNVGEYIKKLRLERELSQEDLGKLLGVQRAAVQKWESGRVQNLKRETIKKLSALFDVSPSTFIIEEPPIPKTINYPSPEPTEDYVTFRVIGEIAAGYDNPAYEDWDGDNIDVPLSYLRGRPMSDYFVLRVKGDSMYPIYHDGDHVLILKQTTMNHSGEVGAVLYDDEYATLKKVEYTMGEDWMRLVPINPNFKPEYIEGERLEHCRVIGIPRLLIREI